MDKEHANKLTYTEMMLKLDELYQKKDELESKYQDILYDIELLETLIMYKFNKDYDRKKKEEKLQWKS